VFIPKAHNILVGVMKPIWQFCRGATKPGKSLLASPKLSPAGGGTPRRQYSSPRPPPGCRIFPRHPTTGVAPSGVDSGRRKGGDRGTHPSARTIYNLHMGFPIGSKVQKRVLTQNECKSFGSEKEGQNQFNQWFPNRGRRGRRAARGEKREGGHEEGPRNGESEMERTGLLQAG